MGKSHCIILISNSGEPTNDRNSLGYKVPTPSGLLVSRQTVSYMFTCIVKAPSLLGQTWYLPPPQSSSQQSTYPHTHGAFFVHRDRHSVIFRTLAGKGTGQGSGHVNRRGGQCVTVTAENALALDCRLERHQDRQAGRLAIRQGTKGRNGPISQPSLWRLGKVGTRSLPTWGARHLAS